MTDKPKRPPGRPPLPDHKRFQILLTEQDIERAKALGNGKVAAGVRRALEQAAQNVGADD